MRFVSFSTCTFSKTSKNRPLRPVPVEDDQHTAMKPAFKQFIAGTWPSILLAILTATASAEPFEITRVEQTDAGPFVIRHTSDPDYYYILYRGTEVNDIGAAVDMALGISIEGQLQDVDPEPATAFYRILQVPIVAPLDTDGDGIDDVWELLHRFPGAALNPHDEQEDHTGSGRPDIEDYLESLPLTAWFTSAGSSALSYGGVHPVAVRFTRPVSGVFAYEVGGDAVAGADFQPLTGELHLADSASVVIPIQLQPAPSLRGPRSLVLTLKRPGDHVQERIDALPSEGHPDRFSSHVITIHDSDQGLYAGTLTFLSQTNDEIVNGQSTVTIVPAPPVSSSSFRMALRSGPDGPHALIELPEFRLLAERLAIPVTFAPDQPGFNSAVAVSGLTIFHQLRNRPVSWQFELVDAAFSDEGRLLDARCRITLEGLTASGIPGILSGTITASRIGQ
jgi:hypothetical protein